MARQEFNESQKQHMRLRQLLGMDPIGMQPTGDDSDDDAALRAFEEKLKLGDVDVARHCGRVKKQQKKWESTAKQDAMKAPMMHEFARDNVWVISHSSTDMFTEKNERMWYISLCTEDTGFVLGCPTCKGKPKLEDYRKTLYMAMAHPEHGQPRRPQAVLFANRIKDYYEDLAKDMRELGIHPMLESRQAAIMSALAHGTHPDGLNHELEQPPEDRGLEPAYEKKEQGNDFFNEKKYAEAIRCYSEAIALAPSDHILFSNRSLAHLKAGDAEAALADADQCLALCPKFAKGRARRGQALEALCRWDEALAVYKRMATKHPEDKFYAKSMERVEAELANRKATNYDGVD